MGLLYLSAGIALISATPNDRGTARQPSSKSALDVLWTEPWLFKIPNFATLKFHGNSPVAGYTVDQTIIINSLMSVSIQCPLWEFFLTKICIIERGFPWREFSYRNTEVKFSRDWIFPPPWRGICFVRVDWLYCLKMYWLVLICAFLHLQIPQQSHEVIWCYCCCANKLCALHH